MTRLSDELGALTTMSKAQLSDRWSKIHRSPAPKISPALLALGIAHRLQARQSANLPPAFAREIKRLGDILDRDGTLTSEPMATIKLGTSLVRSWHGNTHQVLITDRGYVYKGQTYRSLSQIAREITGVQWSGPRFFGIKRRTKGEGRAPPSACIGSAATVANG